jgi:hypothetical protein
LMAMPGKRWYNPQRSGYLAGIYASTVNIAVKDRYTDRNSADVRLVYHSWL